MSRRDLPPTLQAEAEWGAAFILAHADRDGASHPAWNLNEAIRVNSPMLAKRFQMALDGSRILRQPDEEMDQGTKYRLGYLLVALTNHEKGQSWELWSPDPEERVTSPATSLIQMRCTPSYKNSLEARARQAGVSMTQFIRDAIEAYTPE